MSASAKMSKRVAYIPTFASVSQMDVPHSRNGKHKQIVTQILDDLAELKAESAIRIPIKGLDDTLANVRSALNRATRKQGVKVATATDTDYLYVWRA